MRNRSGLVMLVVSLGLVLANIDLFIVNVALPSIAKSMHHADLSELSWTLNGYAIVFAALLVPFGRLADRTSRRNGFLLGVLLFVVASVACARSTDVAMLIAFRVVQAVGAAMLLPTSLGLVLDANPPEKRFSAVRTWASIGSGAVSLAPVVAGPLTDVSWRLDFLINVPIGLFALVLGWRLLPKPEAEGGPLPDLLGSAVLIAAIGALTFGLTEGPSWGWSSASVLVSLVGAALLVALFVYRSANHESPIFEVGLMRNRGFAIGTTATMLFAGALAVMLLSTVLWLQDSWHWSALKAGLGIMPGPAFVPIWAILGGKLNPRLGPGRVVALGSAAFAGALVWWAAAITEHSNYFVGMFGGMCLTGVGVGLAMPTLFGAAAASLPPARFATGSGFVNMIRQIGLTLGTAVLVVITGTAAVSAGELTSFRHLWLVGAGVAVAAGAIGLMLGGPRPAPAAAASAPARPASEASMPESSESESEERTPAH